MTGCYVSNQIADYCDMPDEECCTECHSEMTISLEGGYDVLICDNEECGHKVWADGQEY